MKLIIVGTLENLSTRQDGTIKISFGSQEMDNDAAGKLFSFRGKYLKMLLSDNEITALEANLVDAEKIQGGSKKSQSQRLRACLYRLWEQSGLSIDFEDYYRTEMERLIEGIKAKLTD